MKSITNKNTAKNVNSALSPILLKAQSIRFNCKYFFSSYVSFVFVFLFKNLRSWKEIVLMIYIILSWIENKVTFFYLCNETYDLNIYLVFFSFGRKQSNYPPPPSLEKKKLNPIVHSLDSLYLHESIKMNSFFLLIKDTYHNYFSKSKSTSCTFFSNPLPDVTLITNNGICICVLYLHLGCHCSSYKMTETTLFFKSTAEFINKR